MSALPTRKWWATLITGIFTIGGQAVASGGWDAPEWAQILTLGAGLATAYLVPNTTSAGQAANPAIAAPPAA